MTTTATQIDEVILSALALGPVTFAELIDAVCTEVVGSPLLPGTKNEAQRREIADLVMTAKARLLDAGKIQRVEEHGLTKLAVVE